MRLEHYPGKAVVDDPAWLEMDIPPSTRGRIYEANWIDTQRSLSKKSLNKESFGNGSVRILSRLSHYQTVAKEPTTKTEESVYNSSNRSMTDSVRLKYHSDKCLSRINSKTKSDYHAYYGDNYYLLSQSRPTREQGFKEEHMYATVKPRRSKCVEELQPGPPEPKPRTKLMQVNPTEKYKSVINDLERQIKKSVRFNEKSTEIGSAVDFASDNEDYGSDTCTEHTDDDVTNNNCDSNASSKTISGQQNGDLRLEEKKKENIKPPQGEHQKLDKSHSDSESTQDRTIEWVDTQNRYILIGDNPQGVSDDTASSDVPTMKEVTTQSPVDSEDGNKITTYQNDAILNRNDSGYYEGPKKIRQRIPPRKIYPSSSEFSESGSSAGNRSDSDSPPSSGEDTRSIYDLYKNGRGSPLRDLKSSFRIPVNRSNSKLRQRNSASNDESECNSEFSIPRPKLIVPVHSYAIRKRRTGNLYGQNSDYNECDSVGSAKTSEVDENGERGNR